MKKLLCAMLGLLFTIPSWALPAGYTELEYIESTGTQYIDTGIFGTDGSSFEIRLSYSGLFGAYQMNGWGSDAQMGIDSDLYWWNMSRGRTTVTLNTIYNAKLVISGSKSKLYVNENLENEHSLGSYHNNTGFGLFAVVGGNYPSKEKVYNFVAKDSAGRVIGNFIPAKRNSDSAIGMYDTVGGQFYTNAGSGSFIAGPIAEIKIATTKYVETQFSDLNSRLAAAVATVNTVVSNTISQAASIATLQSGKQTRPNDIADDNEKCPAGKKCLLVEDASGVPHWYEICSSAHCLPEGYTELEYLRSDGNAYINTNYSPTSKTRIEIVAKVDSGAGNVNIVGSGRGTTGVSSDALLVINSLDDSTAEIKFDPAGTWLHAENVNMLEKNKLSLSATEFSVNGDVKLTNNATIPDTDNRPFYIFQRWRPSIESTNNKVQVYEFSIYENDILVRNMIPVKRNSDGVLGMYDLVNDRFYTNAGTGTFTAGPVVE